MYIFFASYLRAANNVHNTIYIIYVSVNNIIMQVYIPEHRQSARALLYRQKIVRRVCFTIGTVIYYIKGTYTERIVHNVHACTYI